MNNKFKCKNGETVLLTFDDTALSVEVTDPNNVPLGGMKFSEVDYGNNDCARKVIWCFLDEEDRMWCRQGIGREILRFVHDAYGLPTVAAENDGMRQDDGSHLTGDAPAFVAQMIVEGLISR